MAYQRLNILLSQSILLLYRSRNTNPWSRRVRSLMEAQAAKRLSDTPKYLLKLSAAKKNSVSSVACNNLCVKQTQKFRNLNDNDLC